MTSFPQLSEESLPQVILPANANGALYFGDNLNILLTLSETMQETVDLVYIDPPFATNNVFKIDNHRANSISASGRIAYADKLTGDAFLHFLRDRLIVIRELMAAHASIYLHIDDKMAYEVKTVMDYIFHKKHFQAAITRIKCNPKNFRRRGFGNIKDTILFYSKTSDFFWQSVRVPPSKDEINRRFCKKDSNGRLYTTTPLHAPGSTATGATGKPWRGMSPPIGRHWRYSPEKLEALEASGMIEWSKNGVPRKIIYADDVKTKGKVLQDVWHFKDPQHPLYPTEKNAEMLDAIIHASSEKNALVMDCFAGSGSTLWAAQKNNRRWLGMDSSPEAIEIIRQRFNNAPYNHR